MNRLLRTASLLVLIGLAAAMPVQAASIYWSGTDGIPFGGTTWIPNAPVVDDAVRICNGTWVDLSDPYANAITTLNIGGTFTETDLVTYPAGTYAGAGELRVSDDGSLTTTAQTYIGYDGYGGTLKVSGGTLNLGNAANESDAVYLGYTSAAAQPAATGTYIQDSGTVTTSYRIYVGYNNGDGNLTLNDGTLNAGNTVYVGYSADSSGSLTINGGILNAAGSVAVGTGSNSATFTMTGGTINGASTAYIGHQKAAYGSMSGGVWNVATRFAIGYVDSIGGTTTFDMTGGTFNKTTTSNEFTIAHGDNDSNFEVAVMNMSNDATVNTMGNVYFGYRGGNATLNMSATGDTAPQFNVTNGSIMTYGGNATKTTVGTVNMGGHAAMNLTNTQVRLGIWGYADATWNLSGNAALNMSAQYMMLGDNWQGPGVSSGTLNLTENATATLASAYISLGDRAFASGTVNMGTLGSATDNPSFTITGSGDGARIYIGRISGVGVWNQNAGTTTVPAIWMASDGDSAAATGSGTLNLNGGTLITTWIRTRNSLGMPATINFNGGTLQAKANSTQFISNGSGTTAGGALMNLNVQAGGAKINTGVYDVTITEPFSQDPASPGGGLDKWGTGTLTLAASGYYTGPTMIHEGTLQVIGQFTSSAFTVVSGATLKGNGALGGLTTQNNSKLVFGATDLISVATAPTFGPMTALELVMPSNPSIPPADQIFLSWPTAVGETNPLGNMSYTKATDCYGIYNYSLQYDTALWPGSSLIKMAFTPITNEWLGAVSNDYDTTPDAQNWVNSGGAAYEPGTDQQAIFGWLSSNFTPNVNQTGLSLGSLIFDNDMPYTLSGNAITLNTAQAENAQIAVLSGAHKINNDLTLNKNTQVNLYHVSSSVTLDGVVSGVGGLTVNGGDKLVLNGANTFTGKIVMNGSTLEVNSIDVVANPNSLGQSGVAPENLVLSGTVHYTGLSAAATDRGFTIAGATTINLDNEVAFTGQVVGAGSPLTKMGAKLTLSNSLVNTLGTTLTVLGDLDLNGGVGSSYAATGDFYIGKGSGNVNAVTLSGNASLSVGGYSEFGSGFGNATFTMKDDSVYIGTSGRVGGYLGGGQVDMSLSQNAKIQYSSFFNFGEAGCIADLTMTDKAKITANSLDFGWGANTNSTGNLDNESSITVTGTFNIAVNGDNALGAVTMNDDATVTAGSINVGSNGVGAAGILTMNDNATATVTGAVAVGNQANANGTLVMSGNTSLTAASWISIGNSYNGGGKGEAFLSGNATMATTNNELEIAWGGTGILHIGDGTVTDNAVVSSFLPVVLGWGTTINVGDPAVKTRVDTNARIDLNGGGTLVAPGIITGNDGGGVAGFEPLSSILNLNGGVLKASADSADFITNAGNSLVFQVNVLENGAKINTDGHNITISAPLTEDAVSTGGGLSKLGDGTLTLTGALSYNGPTVVNQGALTVAALTNSAQVYVASSATLNAGSIVADTLTIGGPQIAATSVAAVPEPSTFVLLALAGLALVGTYIRRK